MKETQIWIFDTKETEAIAARDVRKAEYHIHSSQNGAVTGARKHILGEDGRGNPYTKVCLIKSERFSYRDDGAMFFYPQVGRTGRFVLKPCKDQKAPKHF